MSRIPYPATIAETPAASQPLLQTVQQQIGAVPNMFRMFGTSPAALKAFVGMSGALAEGNLDAQMRERIALAVAEVNGCNYCLSGHTYLARAAKLDDIEITANRSGTAIDPRAAAAVRFAAKIARARGHATEGDLHAVRAAGYSEADIVEIIALVALTTFANYVNSATDTDIDFPVVMARKKESSFSEEKEAKRLLSV